MYGRALQIIFLVLCSLSNAASGSLYPQEIKFQHILKDKDIVLGEVRAIFQDSDGFIWFGGWNALIRYDGHSFKQVDLNTQNNPPQKNVALIHTVDILEDKDKNLWFATSHGLAKYDRYKDRLWKLKDLPGKPPINGFFFNTLALSPKGMILAGSDKGLFIVEPKTEHYKAITPPNNETLSPQYPGHQSINAILVADEENIWIGTDRTLDKFNPTTETFSHTVLDKTGSNARNNNIQVIVENNKSSLWLGTANGVVLYDIQSRKQKRYQHQADDPNSLGANDVWDILKDNQNRIWVSLDRGGLNLYEPKHDHFIRYNHSQTRAYSISSNVVRTAFEDTNGDIWVGVYPEGVDYFDQASIAIKTYTHDTSDPSSLSHNSVLSVAEDTDGNLWLGTDGSGLNFFDRKSGIFTTFKYDPLDKNSPSSNAILTSIIDSQNILWLGTWAGGLTQYDLETKQFKQIPYHYPTERTKESKLLNSGHVWSVYEDKSKTIWIGTHDGGLNKFDRNTSTFTHYWHDETDHNTISSNRIWTSYEDSKNNFWVGTSQGLSWMDREKETFIHFKPDANNPKSSLSDANALSILEDSKAPCG